MGPKNITRRKKVGKMPHQLVPFDNPDKEFHETYEAGDNPIRFPHPFRCCILGGVNSGKSYLARHIFLAHQGDDPHKRPKFENLTIVHGCESSVEYDDLQPTEIIDYIPSYTEFDPAVKTLIIIDDYDFTSLSKDELKKISELMRFASTHCNISIMVLYQNFFHMPKIIKNNANVFVVFKPTDLDELATIGRRVGLQKDVMRGVFKQHLNKWRDSLCINLSPSAPNKYLKNLFQPIIIDQ